MGYTHYWETPQHGFSEREWEYIANIAAAAIEDAKRGDIAVAYEFDEPHRAPVIGSSTIHFNGIGEEGHETFYIAREGQKWEFCKTARKPYDVVVCAVLLALRDMGADVSSDGDIDGGEDHDGWANGHALYKRAQELVQQTA